MSAAGIDKLISILYFLSLTFQIQDYCFNFALLNLYNIGLLT